MSDLYEASLREIVTIRLTTDEAGFIAAALANLTEEMEEAICDGFGFTHQDVCELFVSFSNAYNFGDSD